MSAPPDLGAHSISWCIAPARDYAALSGAEEEMFRETDVPVRPARLSLLFAERVTSLIGELPFGCDERPRPWPLLTGPSGKWGAAYVAGATLSFALAEWKSNGFNVELKPVNRSSVNTLTTHTHTHSHTFNSLRAAAD